MPNFTPGPWKWENDDGNWRLRAQIDIDRNGTCPNFDGSDPIIDDGSAGGEYSQTIDPRTSPNAPLIAAAPELYAALELFLALPTDPSEMQVSEAEQAGRAALAKARGETA